MDMTVLKDYGINCEKGIARCMDDAELYEQILELFLEDTAVARGREALEQRDCEALFACMHELKGVSGNAELTGLYAAVCPLVELLRVSAELTPAISEGFAAVEAAHARTLEGIRLAKCS